MKRYIQAAEYDSYSKALQAIADGLNSDESLKSENKQAVVNKEARCVDVTDIDNPDIIYEQRYPVLVRTQPATRGKFVKVPPGTGDYILTRVRYNKKIYDHNGLKKDVYRTNKQNDTRNGT